MEDTEVIQQTTLGYYGPGAPGRLTTADVAGGFRGTGGTVLKRRVA